LVFWDRSVAGPIDQQILNLAESIVEPGVKTIADLLELTK
jgi:hypothetical protein